MLAIDIEDEGLCVDFRGNEKGVAREMYRHQARQQFLISGINTYRCQNCKVSIRINSKSILSKLILVKLEF
jgi:hypothetical protein